MLTPSQPPRHAITHARALRVLLLACALAFSAGAAPALEIQPNQPTPKFTPTPPTPPPPDSDMPPPPNEDAATQLKSMEEWQRANAALAQKTHANSVYAVARASYHAGDLQSQSATWQGTPLALHRSNPVFTTLSEFEAYRIQSPPAESPDTPDTGTGSDADADDRTAWTISGADLRTTWRTPDGGRHDFGWQTLRLGYAPLVDADSHEFPPITLFCSAAEIGIGYDHLALHQSGPAAGVQPTRYRDGLRATFGLIHFDGMVHTQTGATLGLRIDLNGGLGSMVARAYATFAADYELYLGFTLHRPNPAGDQHGPLPFGGVTLGAHFGSRAITTFGHEPTRFVANWALEPTLTVRLFF